MHTADAVAVATPAPSIGWRLVDVLISLRRSQIWTKSRRAGPLLLIAPAASLMGVLAIGIGYLAWTSLHTYDTFLAKQGHFSFGEYHAVVSDPLFKTDLLRTLAMASLTAALAVAIAIPFSLVMAKSSSRALRLGLMVVIFVPYLTGDITRTFGWLAVLGPNGPLTWLLHHLGLATPDLIGTLWAIGLGTLQVLIPAAVVILLPGVLRLNPELEQAAATLGARPSRTFLHVTLPQLRLSVVGALVACWALSMGDFADPQVLGQGLKDYLANFLQNRYLSIGNPPQGAAAGVLLIAIVTAGAAAIFLLGRVRRPLRRYR
jgi:putative spermidine/putrescine transport system permease protein